MPRQWEKVGVVGVDAGIVWLGDPCYILHRDEKDVPHKEMGKDWGEFCANLDEKEGENNNVAQFNYDMGHPGLGICLRTGYGDGLYEVFVKRVSKKDQTVAEVKIVFIEEGE